MMAIWPENAKWIAVNKDGTGKFWPVPPAFDGSEWFIDFVDGEIAEDHGLINGVCMSKPDYLSQASTSRVQ